MTREEILALPKGDPRITEFIEGVLAKVDALKGLPPDVVKAHLREASPDIETVVLLATRRVNDTNVHPFERIMSQTIVTLFSEVLKPMLEKAGGKLH